MPVVSVIIPNYNHAPYLNQRINSVLAQTFQDFEVIILDDCSPDNSREIIDQYRNHPKVSNIIYNETNSGSTFKQWQKGIELSKGEWIWIAESDDWCEPIFLEKLLAATTENNAVLGFCLSEEVDSNNHLIKKRPMSIPSKIVKGADYMTSNLLYRNDIYNASMVLFNKKHVDNSIFGKLTQYKYAGDWLFFGEIVKKGNIIEVHESLNYFRRHINNVSNSSMKKGLSFFEGLDAVKELQKDISFDRLHFMKKWLYKWSAFNSNFKYSFITNLLILKKIIKASLF